MSAAKTQVLIAVLLIFASILHVSNSTFTCFGKSDQDQNVCSGSGNCTDFNTCTCNLGYFGYECETMAPRYMISTIAGTGTVGYDGDVGLAIDTKLYSPQGVAVSDIGEVYVADTSNNRIRKVFLNGTMQIIAGTGAQGYYGDNGPALNCQFYSPQGISLSPSNRELFIADAFNDVVRKLDLETGIISPYAGSGNRGYTVPGNGYALTAYFNRITGVSTSANGELIFTDSDNNLIRKVYNNGLFNVCGRAQTKSYLGYGGLATSAWIGVPFQISVNSDLDIYFTDIYLNIVSKIKHSTGIVTLVIGSASASGFSGDGGLATNALIQAPRGIAVSSTGELFLADSANNRMRKVFSNGVIVTIAGSSTAGFSGDGGLSTDALLNNPVNVAIRQSRNLSEIYFADSGNHAIRKLTAFCETNYTLIDGLCYLKCFEKTSQDEGVCSGRGNCSAFNQCSCKDGYYGANCEEFDCNGVNWKNSSVCSAQGICGSPENCTCSTGYYGTNCELFDCFGMNSLSACSMNGKCVSYNNCSCNEGYYGQSCESFNCFGIAPNETFTCSSRGSCTGYNTCNCSNGFYGDSCQQFNCYGTPQDSPSVCSGHGRCLTIDQCSCQDGYDGQRCEQYNCSGKHYNDPSACSGRGLCSSNNNCTCNEGYYGATCEQFNCFGISKNSQSVCSAHGYCSSYNNCTCSNGYNGAMCESFTCFGISKNSSSACSGHGLCSSFNNCTCLDGYYGNDCRNFTCFNITQTSPNVCSSNGVCISKNVCQCLDKASGERCEILPISSRVVNLATHNNYSFTIMILFVSLIVAAL